MRTAAVVLAGGGSSRLGRPKQLLTHHGENLVARSVRVAIEAGVERVFVVLGAFASSAELFIAGLDKVEIVMNEEWPSGQASSFVRGIDAAKAARYDAALLMLIDQPLVDSDCLKRLIAAFDDDHRIVASRYADTVGVPAIFGAEYYDELLKLSGDAGAGKWIRARLNEVTTVPMEEAAMDIDTPDDLEKLSRSSTVE